MPPTDKIVWNINPTILTCCIVEPRQKDELRGVLYNVAKIYGNDSVGLVIFHGTENELFVREIVDDWQNVVLHNLNVENLLVSEYSKLLTSKSFYRYFSSTHVLIFQCDSYIFKQIPECYFEFDYVGAPWIKSYKLLDNKLLGDEVLGDEVLRGNGCGNGGISLRNVQTMIEVTTEEGDDSTAEDLYFDKQPMKVCFPNEKLHTAFSIEQIWCDDPCCCHQPYVAMNARLRLLANTKKDGKKKDGKKKDGKKKDGKKKDGKKKDGKKDKEKKDRDKEKKEKEKKEKQIIREYETLLDKIV